MPDPLFDHERLDVYRVARQFKRQLRELVRQIPRGNSDLVDQLKRAARSITNNIAEGSGKWSTCDKVHYFHIARGSATECAANLDECVDYRFLTEDPVRPAREILSRVVAMLVKMILSLEGRAADTMTNRPSRARPPSSREQPSSAPE